MFLPDLVIRSRRVVTPKGMRPAAIHIRGGKIIGVLDPEEVLPDSPIEEVEGVVLPRVVDLSLQDGAATGTQLVEAATLEDLDRFIESARDDGKRIHLIRVPDWEMLTPLFNAQRARIPITAGTTPHDLTVVKDDRDRRNREYLWASLANGLLRTVMSCGTTAEDAALAMVWSGASARGYSIEQVVDWMCRSPAKLAGLTRKGEIDVGYAADLVVFDPDAGRVRRTYVHGARVEPAAN